MSEQQIFDAALTALGWQGGTIHQAAQALAAKAGTTIDRAQNIFSQVERLLNNEQ